MLGMELTTQDVSGLFSQPGMTMLVGPLDSVVIQCCLLLTRLMSGTAPFVWTDGCHSGFLQLNTFLAQDPGLLSPNYRELIILHTKSSMPLELPFCRRETFPIQLPINQLN